MRLVNCYLCKMGNKGRAVWVHQRKTWAAIHRLAAKHPELFVLTAYVVESGPDHGTVYFTDAAGRQWEVENA